MSDSEPMIVEELEKVSSHLTPYVLLVTVVILTGSLLILGILWLRPGVDPLAVLTALGSLTVLGTNQALTFLKTILQAKEKS